MQKANTETVEMRNGGICIACGEPMIVPKNQLAGIRHKECKPAPQREQLLAEYMEKFGKKLNEQEKRVGDELFMWLKDKLTNNIEKEQDD